MSQTPDELSLKYFISVEKNQQSSISFCPRCTNCKNYDYFAIYLNVIIWIVTKLKTGNGKEKEKKCCKTWEQILFILGYSGFILSLHEEMFAIIYLVKQGKCLRHSSKIKIDFGRNLISKYPSTQTVPVRTQIQKLI